MSSLLPLRYHMLIGLFMSGIILATCLFILRETPVPSKKDWQATEAAPRVRPIYLAAMDPVPDLPRYLLTLCGPEVLQSHGGTTATNDPPEWFLQAAKTLAENGLKWPSPSVGIDDPVLQANVREHEARAAPMLADDPVAAVALLEPLIRYEEDKFQARYCRAELQRSAAGHLGRPDAEIYKKMLADLPDRYFTSMIDETLNNYPDPRLVAIACSQAMLRKPGERFAALATIVGKKSLDFAVRESTARTLAADLNITFDPGKVAGIDWLSEVSKHLQSISAK